MVGQAVKKTPSSGHTSQGFFPPWNISSSPVCLFVPQFVCLSLCRVQDWLDLFRLIVRFVCIVVDFTLHAMCGVLLVFLCALHFWIDLWCMVFCWTFFGCCILSLVVCFGLVWCLPTRYRTICSVCLCDGVLVSFFGCWATKGNFYFSKEYIWDTFLILSFNERFSCKWSSSFPDASEVVILYLMNFDHGK